VSEVGVVPVRAVAPEPGEMISVDIDGTVVAVANIDGELRAFDDTCTHKECPLSEGRLLGLSVICPCHQSRFDLRTGEPLNGPAERPIRIRGIRQDGGVLLIDH